MSQFKFQALAELVSQRRQERIEEIRKQSPHPALFPESHEKPRGPKQISLTFEDLSPVLDVYQGFDEASREIEWSFYSSSGEFLLQYGFSLAEGSYRVHSVHPELFLERAEMRGFLEAINQRLDSAYPRLELVQTSGRAPIVQRKAK